MHVYLNDRLVDASQALVSVFNPAVSHGVGLFETVRAYGGKVFRLEAHLQRMRASAVALDMPVAAAIERVPEAIATLLAAEGLSDARIRFTVTPPGAHEGQEQPTLFVTAGPVGGYPPELYAKGMTVCVLTAWRQSRSDPLAGHKTICYFPKLLGLREAQARQCGEALWFTPENLLAEGCVSSVFVVKSGQVRTPPLDTPVLPGVTRAAVLEVAGAAGIDATETPCTINDLLDADEVFLTNAIMEVMPVTHVERRPIGNEQPGGITRRLAEAYRELTRQA